MRKAALFLLLAAACGGLPAGDVAADLSRSVPLPASVIPAPLVRQQTDYSCGDVATLSLLRYWHHEDWKEVGEKALYGPLDTTAKDGTEPQAIADFLGAQPGLFAEVQDTSPQIADLEAAVDRGEPPIVDIQAWQSVKSVKDLKPWASDWIDGHYVVLVAYDKANFFFMDPSTGRHYAYIPRGDLAARWHDVVGKENRKTQHLVIFVRGWTEAWTPANPLPPKATPID